MELSDPNQVLLNEHPPLPATLTDEEIESAVRKALSTTQIIDVHTHLYPPTFGNIGLWGIDELLTYHYLEAEFFRYSDVAPEKYWPLSK